MTRILGIDPGLCHTGWGLIDVIGNQYTFVGQGVISPTQKDLPHRLTFLFQHLSTVIETYQPTVAVVEETFVNQNPQSTLKLGMARGVILMTPAHFGIPVVAYTANHIKKSVVGAGHADKIQVKSMIMRLLPTAPKEMAFDSADALAAALCHAHHAAFHLKVV